MTKDNDFQQKKDKLKEIAKVSKRISKGVHLEFLDSISNELKIFIENRVSFKIISKAIEEVFGKKIASQTILNFCANKGLYKRRKTKKQQ